MSTQEGLEAWVQVLENRLVQHTTRLERLYLERTRHTKDIAELTRRIEELERQVAEYKRERETDIEFLAERALSQKRRIEQLEGPLEKEE